MAINKQRLSESHPVTGLDQQAWLESRVIVAEKGLKQVSDSSAIEGEIDKVSAANPDKVVEFQAGKEKMIGWFVGQVMQATRGKANPQMVNQLLREKLKT